MLKFVKRNVSSIGPRKRKGRYVLVSFKRHLLHSYISTFKSIKSNMCKPGTPVIRSTEEISASFPFHFRLHQICLSVFIL